MFKRTEDEKTPCISYITMIYEWPLTFLRDYSVPMGDFADWDRKRAAILPLTIPAVCCIMPLPINDTPYYFDPDTRQKAGIVTLFCLIPGLMFSLYIFFRTTQTRPNNIVMMIYAWLGFIMSILWISFTGDVVIDLI